MVNDSPDYSLASGDLPCLLELHVPANGSKTSLGQLRNIGINAVPNGNVWVQWDDDGKRFVESVTRVIVVISLVSHVSCLQCRLARA